MQPSDSTLLRQFVENESEEAFRTLVDQYINLVYSVAMRSTGRSQDAEEITQAVFIILARKAAQLRHEKALSSWLFRATRLTANNYLRGEIRRKHREHEVYMQSALNEPENHHWPEMAPLLDDAVAGLGDQDRRAILCRFYEGRNLREVGEALGTNEDAAQKRIERALEKLKKVFMKRGVNSTTVAIGETITSCSLQLAPVALAKTVTALAIAKGATTSTSTLTLIKGALKLMAWTKMKTVVVIGVAVILATGTTSLLIKHQHQVKAQTGRPVPENSWASMGYATPEAALQTSLWAMSKGDMKNISDSFTPGFDTVFMQTAGKGKSDRELSAMFVRIAGNIGGFRTISNEVVADDELVLHFYSTGIGNGTVPMKNVDGEWKISGNIIFDARNDSAR